MKKILLILFGLLFVSGAYSAQIANVEYVHKMIEQTWDITVPYNSALNSVKQIANMKYLLSAIDVANHMLNGSATTDYSNGEFATLQVADTDTVNTAIETLVTDSGGRNYKFFITTTSNTTSFKFYLSAAGEFVVDWGDGTRNKITRTNTEELEYSHNYSTAGTYTIKIGGKATAYNTNDYIAAIGFSNTIYYYYADNIASIDGSLGAIFGTLSSDTNNQPRFFYTFQNAYNMKGSIPSDLFAGISGTPASYMFYQTFLGCSGLTGAIPNGLFGNLTGAPASYMFYGTFSGCSKLTSIPENLFGNISGPAQDFMFKKTFYNCISLTGPSARINGQYLYEIWPSATSSQVSDMYYNATGLSDYSNIPSAWK